MTRSERLDRARKLLEDGVPDGMTLREALELCERLLVESTLIECGSMPATAERLGLTREGLWKIRKRVGMPRIQAPHEKPIPDDWRERLEEARS